MNKLQNIINSYITEELNDQLSRGIAVESEHKDVYDYFKEFCDKNKLEMPLTEKQLYTMIAKAHLKEIPGTGHNDGYYSLLDQMEKSAKK